MSTTIPRYTTLEDCCKALRVEAKNSLALQHIFNRDSGCDFFTLMGMTSFVEMMDERLNEIADSLDGSHENPVFASRAECLEVTRGSANICESILSLFEMDGSTSETARRELNLALTDLQQHLHEIADSLEVL